jgi:hypothetical protein
MKDIDLSSNRMCAEISYFKSPNKFWIRLEQHKSAYNDMISKLQTDYRNAYEEFVIFISIYAFLVTLSLFFF